MTNQEIVDEARRILYDEKRNGYFSPADIAMISVALGIARITLRAQEEAKKNEPLTLEELRQMDGEPVWLETGEVSIDEQIVGQWAIIHSLSDTFMVLMGGGNGLRLDNYSKTWLAYRHKPKEAT